MFMSYKLQEEKKQREAEAKRKRLEEAERKRQAMMEAMEKQKQVAKPNFVISKKDAAPQAAPSFDKVCTSDKLWRCQTSFVWPKILRDTVPERHVRSKWDEQDKGATGRGQGNRPSI